MSGTAFKIVVVGTSYGGLNAAGELLGKLPSGFPLPVVMVMHRAAESDELASILGRYSTMPVDEVQDKIVIEKGRVYISPAEYHILVDDDHISLSTEGPVQYARPSIDVLFESAAEAYSEGVIGVLLTGSNRDGTNGLAAIKSRGGVAVVQDPETAEAGTMPRSAIDSVGVDHVLPLSGIADCLMELTRG